MDSRPAATPERGRTYVHTRVVRDAQTRSLPQVTQYTSGVQLWMYQRMARWAGAEKIMFVICFVFCRHVRYFIAFMLFSHVGACVFRKTHVLPSSFRRNGRAEKGLASTAASPGVECTQRMCKHMYVFARVWSPSGARGDSVCVRPISM